MKGEMRLLNRLNRIKDAVDSVPVITDDTISERAENVKTEYDKTGYSGVEAISVSSFKEGDRTWTIIASGPTLLFVEFGTGIIYPHDNPIESDVNYAGSWSIEHGQYLTDSEKLAKYKGGWPSPIKKGEVEYGNPSANVMYNTWKNLEPTVALKLKRYLEKAVK